MKEVYVTIHGKGTVYWLENFNKIPENWNDIDLNDYSQLEEDGWLDGFLNERAFILEMVGLYAGPTEWSKDVDILFKKGKMIMKNDIFKNECGLKTPFYALPYSCGVTIKNTYRIELEDDEEFDSRQLQLVKTDNEVEFVSKAIMGDYIVYKGVEIAPINEPGYKDRRYHALVCHKFIND